MNNGQGLLQCPQMSEDLCNLNQPLAVANQGRLAVPCYGQRSILTLEMVNIPVHEMRLQCPAVGRDQCDSASKCFACSVTDKFLAVPYEGKASHKGARSPFCVDFPLQCPMLGNGQCIFEAFIRVWTQAHLQCPQLGKGPCNSLSPQPSVPYPCLQCPLVVKTCRTEGSTGVLP